MNIPEAKKISNIIDSCWVGVSESSIGPITILNPTNLQERKFVQIPLGLFLNIAQAAVIEYIKETIGGIND